MSTERKILSAPTVGPPPVKAVLSLFAAGALSAVFAGGPLDPRPHGIVVKWDVSKPVLYRVDPGPLSSSLTHENGVQSVRDAFNAWTSITTSQITVQEAGKLSEDVTHTNFNSFTNLPRPETSIIFDADGQIINQVFGAGSSSSVLGFAAPLFSDANNFFTYGIAVLNGTQAGRSNFVQVVTHELGHLLGLDHTQVNVSYRSGSFFNRQFVPLMFPIALTGQRAVPLHDDRVWFSWLYPAPGPETAVGRITARALRRSGLPFGGAHVVAVKAEPDGLGGFSESATEVVGGVSDFLLQNEGSVILPGLTPGQYFVFMEPLDPTFTEGSGVGPFETRFVDFPKDYFNGQRESGDPAVDDPNERVAITVREGAVESLDLISNNERPEERPDGLASVQDDESVVYEFPGEFVFPSFGKIYGYTFVNSDGNLTFVMPDSESTPRSESRFLQGPPRVAPLFTDLDPGSGGQLKAAYQPGRITFEWDKVPEFVEPTDPRNPGPNTVSVTLFSTGEIHFRYGEINVTPDERLHSVVGITPGFFGTRTGTSRDFSPLVGSDIPIGDQPLYEVFPESSFDLAGNTLRFKPPVREYFLPFMHSSPALFTGFAATNFSTRDASITMTSLEADGTLSSLPNNPSARGLLRGRQFALVESQIFGSAASGSTDSWVRFVSSADEVSSFFQFGTLDSTKLDGGLAVTEVTSELIFSRIYAGVSFPTSTGPIEARTILSIANPGETTARIAIRYFDARGVESLGPVLREIPPNGLVRDRVGVLLNTPQTLGEGHIRITVVEGPGVIGFSHVELPDSLFGLNALRIRDSQTFYSAQLAHGSQDGIAYFTSLKLVNTGTASRRVTITSVAGDGLPLGSSFSADLGPNESLQRDVDTLFALSPAAGTLVVGSIKVQTDGPGIVGDVVFGDPMSGRFTAALGLQDRLITAALFGQVANGRTNPDNAETDFFTGVAVFNPGESEANVVIEVFDARGRSTGRVEFALPPQQRISSLIEELMPATANQLGGYIRLTSGQPVVVQQLFGNSSLSFLSAVPPEVIH